MHKIYWTNTAVKSYSSILARTASFEQKLDQVLNIIQKFPTSFPFDETRKAHKAVINKRNILYYDVYPNNIIYLILFFDTKMDTEKLKKLLL